MEPWVPVGLDQIKAQFRHLVEKWKLSPRRQRTGPVTQKGGAEPRHGVPARYRTAYLGSQ
jgi:hypothetical protein